MPLTGHARFPGGVGKTGEDGDLEELLDDVTGRIVGAYGDATVVCPGRP